MSLPLYQARAHMKQCAEECANSHGAFIRAVFLAVGSQQIRSSIFWRNLADAWRTYKSDGIDAARNLYGMFFMSHKYSALKHVENEYFYRLYRGLSASEAHELLWKECPGLGVVKAGFAVQMTHGKIGCIDTVNAQRLGIDQCEMSRMNMRKNGAQQYRDLLASLPELSPVPLWRDWCEAVAARDKIYTASELSIAHYLFIKTGDPQINVQAKKEAQKAG